MMENALRVIDGSLLEGGGQILRNALSLSIIMKTPVKISKIRTGRSKPGLMEQHLKGVELVRDLSQAHAVGIDLGSCEVEIHPKGIFGGNYSAVVKTAGNISLLLQVALPCTLFADQETTFYLQGGTNAEMAPQIDYLTEVFKPNLEKFGASFDLDLIRRGYFPKGGGEVVVKVPPIKELKSVCMLQQGCILKIYGWSFVAGQLSIGKAHAMAKKAVNVLREVCKVDIERYKERDDVAPLGTCAGIILVAKTSTGCYLGASALSKQNEDGEVAGKRAANELLAIIKTGACVDDHVQDQIIIFMALAKGVSKVKVGNITMHTKTAIHVAESLTSAKFHIETFHGFSVIECEGIGHSSL